MNFKEGHNTIHQLKDNSGRANNLVIVFKIFIGITVLEILLNCIEYAQLNTIGYANYIAYDRVSLNQDVLSIIVVIHFCIYLISIVFFLRWFRRAYGNLLRARVYTNFEESMAIWAFFIPIIFLWRPYGIMNEIWKGTQWRIKNLKPSFEINHNTSLIQCWWILFIISHLLGTYLMKTQSIQDSFDQVARGLYVGIISDVISVIEAILVIMIVRKISNNEDIMFHKMEKDGIESDGTLFY